MYIIISMFKQRKDVHELNLRDLTSEQLTQESLINLAHRILVEKGQAIPFNEITDQIIALGARTEAQLKDAIVQFYTDMNIDGRFLVLGESRWGLREWYAIDQVEEETAPTVKVHDHEDEEIDLEIDKDDDEELVLEDNENDFEDESDDDLDRDLNEDEEDDELAGLDVVEEDMDLDDEDDDYDDEEDEDEK